MSYAYFNIWPSLLIYETPSTFTRLILFIVKSLHKEQNNTNLLQSNLTIRNFLVALKLFLNAKNSLSLNGKLVIGNGSLIPICSLQNRFLLPSLTLLTIWSNNPFLPFQVFETHSKLSFLTFTIPESATKEITSIS